MKIKCLNKSRTIYFIFTVLMFLFLANGCGKKETTSNDDKKTDSKSDSKSDAKDILSLDKPVYVEFQVSGDVTGTVKTYYKDKKFKSETNMNMKGNEIKSTIYSDGTTMYTVSELGGVKTGMKMDASKYSEQGKDNFDMSTFKDKLKDYTKIGEEDIIGKHCDIYQSNKNADLKMSVYQEMIPLKIQMKSMTLVATKLDKDVNVNDDIFNPPSDVKFMDMNSMMKDLKNSDKMKDAEEQMKNMEEGMKNLKK